MTLPRTVADVLTDHVVLEVECIDRLYLNVYQPRLQYPGGAAAFLVGHRGARFASSALMDPISKTFVASIHRFARDQGVPVVAFEKGQRKDDVAHEYLAEFKAAGRSEGVLFVGVAQEKTRVFRTEKRRNLVTGAPYPWIVRSTGVVNHFSRLVRQHPALPRRGSSVQCDGVTVRADPTRRRQRWRWRRQRVERAPASNSSPLLGGVPPSEARSRNGRPRCHNWKSNQVTCLRRDPLMRTCR